MAERNSYIDFLRFLGITLIVIAHINAPFTITQIRCFDVPMMVFISGLSYSGRDIVPSWTLFYYPRIKRLLIPVYLYLILYVLGWLVVGKPVSTEKVIGSFLLLENPSIGYVWIIKIFLLIMIITPLLVKINNKLCFGSFCFCLFFLFSLQEIIVLLCNSFKPNALIGQFFKESFYSIIGYSIPFLCGLRFKSIEKRTGWITLIYVTFFLLIGLLLYLLQNGTPIEITPRYKYPPYRYFILYGTCISLILWLFRDNFMGLSKNKIVLFIGQNTMWIYLWHIAFVYFANRFVDGWIARYIIVYSGSIAVFSVQYITVKVLSAKKELSLFKYLLC